MKLTITEIHVLKDGAALAAARYRTNAEAAERDDDSGAKAYWLLEAHAAEQLHAALKDALSVTIESARLDAPRLPV